MPLPKECQLCNQSSKEQLVVTRHVYGDKTKERSFFRCSACKVIYQYPPLTQQEEEQFYLNEFESFMSSRSGEEGGWMQAENHIKANEKTRIRRMKYLSKFIESNSRILEVGCSTGFMLWPLKESGLDCVGIEPSGVFSNFVQERGLEVYESLEEFSNHNSDQKFDLIMHFFVLEHISRPLDFLLDQLKLLKPGGKIIFEIPNSSDPLVTVYEIPEFEKFYWSTAHPWYFNEDSTKFLLDKLSSPYEILLDQRYDLSNHLIWARDGKPGGMERFTGILGKELDEAYKAALIKSKMCDTIIGIISKE